MHPGPIRRLRLTREDVLAYEAFLANPTCEAMEAMLGPGQFARPLFAGPLSAASQHQAMGILAGLFTYLVNAGYLAGNPWTLPRTHGSMTLSCAGRSGGCA